MMTNVERRAKFRKGLSTLYLPIYDFLCQELPPEWAPFQGMRTLDEQTALYNQGRTTPGPRVTDAQAGMSAHNYGCASDWTIFEGGKPVWMKIDDFRWRTYQQALEKVGARWGGDWNRNGSFKDERFVDGPHNELSIDCSWRHVAVEYFKSGMRSAQEYIEKRVLKRPDLGQTK